MSTVKTYRELLLELESFEKRVEAEVDRQVNDAERVESLEARSETEAIRDRVKTIELKYLALLEALVPILGARHVDEPLVIHDIRKAIEDVDDAIDLARTA